MNALGFPKVTSRTFATLGAIIYDLQGRVVRRFAERAMAPGRLDVVWDGSSDDGHPARGGLYFYRAAIDRGPTASGVIVVSR